MSEEQEPYMPTARSATLDDDLSDVPLQPILDLWEGLVNADPSVKFPALGPEHVRVIAVVLRNYRGK